MASQAFENATTNNLNTDERERLIRKIKACLARGASSSANEAEIAMRQAKAMMDKYRLSEMDVALAGVDEVIVSKKSKRMSDWQRSLADIAADVFGCKLLGRKTSTEVGFIFIGVMPAAELAAYAYDSLLAQLTHSRKAYLRANGGGRSASEDFSHAWVFGVARAVREFAAANGEGTQNALLVIRQKESDAIEHWTANKYSVIKRHELKERKFRDSQAMCSGYASGQEARINQAVSGRCDGPLALAAS